MTDFHQITEEIKQNATSPEAKEMLKKIMAATDYDKKIFEIATTFPEMTCTVKIIVCVLNIFLPGVGTLVMSTRYTKCSKVQLLIAILQMMMAFEIVGFLWSFFWVILICVKSPEIAEEKKKLMQGIEGAYNVGQVVVDGLGNK